MVAIFVAESMLSDEAPRCCGRALL